MIDMRKDLADYNSFRAPGVEVHCLYGTNTDTVKRWAKNFVWNWLQYSYKTISSLDFGTEFNSDPTIIEGDGDGTVNKRSLMGCRYWKNATNRLIHVREFPGIDHMQILDHSEIIDYVLNAVVN